jgi:hypothetical protein
MVPRCDPERFQTRSWDRTCLRRRVFLPLILTKKMFGLGPVRGLAGNLGGFIEFTTSFPQKHFSRDKCH